MPGEIIVLVTCSLEQADSLASALVEEKLAACVNILPKITSVYRWNDALCKEAETLLLIKSNLSLWDHLEARILALHTYEIPEIVCLPIEKGHKPYMLWLNSQLEERFH